MIDEKSKYTVKSAKKSNGLSERGRARVDHIIKKNKDFLKKLAKY